jgi:uncharacterized protein YjbJ (UPF0337 family)
MDWNRVEGNWKQIKGKVKEQWGKLTDDDLDVIAGKQDQLEGHLQQRYGYAKDQAQKEINTWYDRQTWQYSLGQESPASAGLFRETREPRAPFRHASARQSSRIVLR